MSTPSRVSRRLSQKRKLDGPDATSPLVRLKKKYNSEFLHTSIKKEKQSPTKVHKAKKLSREISLKLPRLQLVDIMSEIPAPKTEIVGTPVEKEVEVMVREVAEELESLEREVQFAEKEANPEVREVDPADDFEEHEEDVLRKALEEGVRKRETVEADEIFSVVGAVVAAGLVKEMTLDGDDWIKGTEQECRVWTKCQDHLLVFGSVQGVADAQQHLLQHLCSVREERQRREVEEREKEEAAKAKEEEQRRKEEEEEEELSRKPTPSLKKAGVANHHACRKCKGQFVSEEALAKHEAYHVQGEGNQPELPDLSQFYEPVGGGGHTTTGVKTAYCNKCDWQGTPSNFIKHTHKCKFRVFACNICPAEFPTDYRFKKHFASHFDDQGNLLAEKVTEEEKVEEGEGGGVEEEVEEDVPMVEDVDEGLSPETGELVAADVVVNALMELSVPPADADVGRELTDDVPEEERELVAAVASDVYTHACTLCEELFACEDDFCQHYDKHFDEESGALVSSLVTKELSSDQQEFMERSWSEKPNQVPTEILQRSRAEFKSDAASFKCRFCAFMAKTEDDMQKHVGSHLKIEYECSVCNRKFLGLATLNRHMSKAHGMPTSTEDPEMTELCGEFICEVDPSDPESWEALMVKDYSDPKVASSNVTLKVEGEEDFCAECGYKGSRHAIYKHRMRHHTNNVHPCQVCSKTFSLFTDLTIHMRIHNKKKVKSEKDEEDKELKKRFMCRLCGYRGNMQAVRMHMQRKHKPGGHQCPTCGDCLATKGELNRHSKIHLTSDEVRQRTEKRRRVPDRVWACHICAYTTRHSETDLKEHISRKHEAPKFKCEYCGKMFGVTYDLKDHINHMHLKLRRVVCEVCGLEVHRKNLKAHVQRVHEKLRPFQCDICHRSFGDRRFLLRHKTHHLPKEKRETTVFCKVCNKVYVSQKSLDDHMNVHRGVKPYACDQCDARFSKRIMWQRHKRNHVRGLIKCPVTDCNRLMETELLLNNHMVKKHRETAQFQCSQCQQIFSLRSVVDKHRCNPPEPPQGIVAFTQEAEDGSIQVLQEAETMPQETFVIKEELLGQDQSLILADDEALQTLQVIQPEEPSSQENEETKVFMCSICQAMFTSMEEIEVHIATHVENSEDVVQVEDIGHEGVVHVTNEEGVAQEGLLVQGDDGVFAISYAEDLEAVESAEALTELSFIQE